jgi:hypothetical protein
VPPHKRLLETTARFADAHIADGVEHTSGLNPAKPTA